MKKFTRTCFIASTAAAALALTGCSPTFEVAAPEQDSTPAVPADAGYGTYGSDAELDALQDQCASGDTEACDDLFWESPLDSEYEEFAADRMDLDSDGGGFTEQEAADLAYELVLETLPGEITPDLCVGYVMDPDLIVGAYVDGFTGTSGEVLDFIPLETIEADAQRIFAEVCGV